jgi:hypothetical protein
VHLTARILSEAQDGHGGATAASMSLWNSEDGQQVVWVIPPEAAGEGNGRPELAQRPRPP